MVADTDGDGDTFDESDPVSVPVFDSVVVGDSVGVNGAVGDPDDVCQFVDDDVTVTVAVTDSVAEPDTVGVIETDGDVSNDDGAFSCSMPSSPSWPYVLSPQHRMPPSFINAHM